MIQILQGDCREVLRTLPDESVHCCVTSPPYWGLRDYGVDGQIGLEETPDEFTARLVEVFREVRRVLRADGTCWVNLGDSYATDRGGTTPPAQTVAGGVSGIGGISELRGQKDGYNPTRDCRAYGLKHKELVGIPWRVAFALQADGWWLRQDIIWHKPNPMPESVTDRCTKAHEYLFLLTKSARYWWDADAMKETAFCPEGSGNKDVKGAMTYRDGHKEFRVHAGLAEIGPRETRNKRSVWTVPSEPYKGAHFATYPPSLIRPCILAGCPVGGTVLDPFGGSGTTGQVAIDLGRRAVLIELNPEYIALAWQRTNVTPGLALA